MNTPEIQLQLAAGEITIALSATMRCLSDPTHADQLPAAAMALRDTTNSFLDLMATHKPLAYMAMHRGIPNLRDLHASEKSVAPDFVTSEDC